MNEDKTHIPPWPLNFVPPPLTGEEIAAIFAAHEKLAADLMIEWAIRDLRTMNERRENPPVAGEDIPPGWPVHIGADGKVYPAVPVPQHVKDAMQIARNWEHIKQFEAEFYERQGREHGEDEGPKPETWRDRPPLL